MASQVITQTHLSTEDRVYNLNVELLELEQAKKSASKEYSEEIKRVKAEIKDLIDEKEHPTEKGEEEAEQ